MTKRFLTDVSLEKNQLVNAVIERSAAPPANPAEGQVYYNTTSKATFQFNGTSWITFDPANAPNGSIPLAKLATAPVTSVTGTAPIAVSGGTTPAVSIAPATTSAAGSMSGADKAKLDGIASGATANATNEDLRNRSTHTGTQTAATISDFDTAVRTNRLDQMAAPTSAVGMGGQRLAGLGAPTAASNDAVRQVDLEAAIAGIANVRKFSATIGDGTATQFTVTHNLNTRDVQVSVYATASPFDEVGTYVTHTTVNSVLVTFNPSAVPASGAFRVVVVG